MASASAPSTNEPARSPCSPHSTAKINHIPQEESSQVV